MRSIDALHYLLEMQLLRERVPSFDDYPFSLAVIHNLDKLVFHPAITFIIGENGTGKSTLLEAIAAAWGFNPEGGTKNFNFSTRTSHSDLYKHIRLVKSVRRPKDGFFLRAESYFNVGTEIEKLDKEFSFSPPIINSYGGKSLHEQSHGESFFSLMLHRFGGNGLYILDEPEAALSPTRQMAMLSRLQQLINQGSQFIIATHSPIILSYPNSHIFELNDGQLHLTPYEETEHYSVTKNFLNRYQSMLKELID
jgi:predicted ATPase